MRPAITLYEIACQSSGLSLGVYAGATPLGAYRMLLTDADDERADDTAEIPADIIVTDAGTALIAALSAAVVPAVQTVQQQPTPADIFGAYSLSHLSLPPQQ